MRQFDRLLGIFTSLLLSAFILLLYFTNRIGEYHHSFTQYVHPITWVFFFGGVFGAFYLLYRCIFTGKRKSGWVGGALLGGLYSAFFTFPRSIGFTAWMGVRSDALYHFADVNYILQTGEFAADNLYPLIHIEVASWASITGLSPEAFQSILGLCVTALLAVGSGLFARRFSENSIIGISVAIACSVLVFGKYQHHFMPWFFTFAFIPYLLFFVVIGDELRWEQKGVAFVLGLFLIFGHPMTAIVGLILVLIFIVSNKSGWGPFGRLSLKTTGVWLLALPIAFFVWFYRFQTFQSKLQHVLLSFVYGRTGGAAKASVAVGTVYSPFQLFREYILGKWAGLLIIAIGGIALLILLLNAVWKWKSSEYKVGKFEAVTAIFACFYIIGLAIAVLLLVFNAIATNPIRINQITIWASLLIIGLLIGAFADGVLQESSWNRVAAICVLILFVAMAIYMPTLVYPENIQHQSTETEGIEYLFSYRNPGFPVKTQDGTHKQTVYSIGKQKTQSLNYENWIFRESPSKYQLPRRMGYGGNETLMEMVGKNSSYIAVAERNTEWWHSEPSNRWPTINMIRDSDIHRADSDPTADSIYTNGNYWVWLVSSS